MRRSPLASATKVLERTTSRVGDPNTRLGSYTPAFFPQNLAAIGTVEFTGLLMMLIRAWKGHTRRNSTVLYCTVLYVTCQSERSSSALSSAPLDDVDQDHVQPGESRAY